MKKNYLEMTVAEQDELACLTPDEKAAVDALIAAVRALPKNICFEVTDNLSGDGNLVVSKRIGPGLCQQVASLRKASICFF